MRRHPAALAAAVLVAISAVLSSGLPASGETTADVAKTATRPLRGISVAGSEFSSTQLPTFDAARSYRFLASRGFTVVRLPFLWESIQPTLDAPLDSAVVARLRAAVTHAEAAGLDVIIDVHNYARYNGIAYGASGSFTSADFADLWTRLSTEFRNDPGVVGYGLMNEPHDLPQVAGVSGNERWQQAQQAALTAIRANGDVTCVLVSGYSWSSLAGWFNETNGQSVPYITDPANNFRWEAHDYWDADSSGTYPSSYASVDASSVNDGYPTLEGDRERTRVKFQLDQWIAWLKQYNQKGYLGEFGWPSAQNATSPEDAAKWDDLAKLYLAEVNATSGDLLWTTAWATGTAWPTGYVLQYYGSTDGVLTTPLSNAATLEGNAIALNPNPPALDPLPPTDPPADPGDAGDIGGGDTSAPPASDPPVPAAVLPSTANSHVRVTVSGTVRHPKLTIRVMSTKRVTGTVSVKLGTRVLVRSATLHSGKAVVKIKPRLSARTHRLVVRYGGSKTVAASRATATARR